MPMLARAKTSRPRMRNGLGERLQDAVGDGLGDLAALELLEQDRELVAAEPGRGVAAAQAGAQAARDLDAAGRRRPA